MNTDRRYIKDTLERVRAKQYRRRCSIGNDAEKYMAHKLVERVLCENLVDVSNNNLYEIYTCNPEPVNQGVYIGRPAGSITGWDIKWVLAPNKEAIKQYPFFDCIISVNDNSTGQAIDAELFIPK